MDARTRKQLIRDASHLRSASQQSGAKESNRPVEWFMLHLLQKEETTAPVGIVVGVDRTQCVVRLNGSDLTCRGVEGIAPGDRVRVSATEVVEVLPRTTTLHRREGKVSRLLAANVEVVVIVVSVVAPPLHPRLIDRYLAAIELGGARPAVCVNKADLGISTEEDLALSLYEGIVPLFKTSAEAGLGIGELRDFLGSRMAALVGHSGVGKSSLLNALMDAPAAAAGTVSSDTGKGRHTTTRSTLHESQGLRLLDTPGIREFAVDFESPADVALGFSEIARVSASCQFADCLHVKDQGCAVAIAVRTGAIKRERYQSYLKLLAESFPASV